MIDVEGIKKIQRGTGLTNEDFAHKIGVHPVTWRKIKSGMVPLSNNFRVKVDSAFPDEGIFLSENAINNNQKVTQNSRDKPPSKNLCRLWSKAVGIFRGRLKPPVN